MKYQTVYFCGYAKLPQTLSANIVYNYLTLGLKIDLESGIVENVSCTLLSDLAMEMVASYMVGKHIERDYEAMIEEISYRHQGNAQKSIIKALGEIHKKYQEFVRTHV